MSEPSAPCARLVVHPLLFSEPFLFQVVHVEPVVHHPVTRKELLDVILHVFLEFQGQIAQVQVGLFVIPGNELGARLLLSMSADSRSYLIVSRAVRDTPTQSVLSNFSKVSLAFTRRPVGMI